MCELETMIQNGIMSAMKAKDEISLSSLRAVKTAIQNEKTSGTFHELSDADVLKIIQKIVKQRVESENIYREAGRTELADAEAKEREVLERFLPKALTEDELKSVIDGLFVTLNVQSMKDMGKVMAELNKTYAGRFDGKTASGYIKSKF